MSDEEDKNPSIILALSLAEEGKLSVAVADNLDSFDEDESIDYLLDLAYGLRFNLDVAIESLTQTGRVVRTLQDLLDQEDPEIEFEPDEALLKAIEQNTSGTIIHFNKKKLN